MSPEDRVELRKLAEAATPGPWRWYKYGILASGPNGETRSIVSWDYAWGEAPDCNEADDKPFIVAANPAAVVSLLDDVEQAERQTQRRMIAALYWLAGEHQAERERATRAAPECMATASSVLEYALREHRSYMAVWGAADAMEAAL